MNKNVAVDMSAVAEFAVAGAVEYKINNTKDAIQSNEISNSRIKGLTVSLLEASKPSVSENNQTLVNIAKCIFAWEENKELAALRASILSRYADRQDICSIYLCKDNQIASFVVIMEDSTVETVFEYNEIGFELSEKHREIEDFMVIDNEEAEGCAGLLSNYNLIYKRG